MDFEFNQLMQSGGPVMWVIFVVAWLAFIMLIERSLRILAWRKKAMADQAVLDQQPQLNAQQSLDKLTGSPIAMVLNNVSWAEIKTREDLAEGMNTHLAEVMPRLEGSLPTIAIIGSLLPMLGLLGTVMGMIEVFQVIAIEGTGNAQDMAGGISQALLTTASGLIIAIPVIFAHHLLARQLRYVLAVTEQSMHTLYSRSV